MIPLDPLPGSCSNDASTRMTTGRRFSARVVLRRRGWNAPVLRDTGVFGASVYADGVGHQRV